MKGYAPCTVDELKSKGYDYWALGHIHQREIVSEAPWIVFPGNIQGRHIKETGSKGATLVTVEDGHVVAVTRHDLDVLRWSICRLNLSECETNESVYEAVRQIFEQELERADGKPLALRLILTGKCPVHTQLLDRTAQWTEEFRGIATSLGDIWLEKVQFQTTRKGDFEKIVNEDTPVAGLLRSIKTLELDDDTLLKLVPELTVLKNKLPAEINTASEPFLETSLKNVTELRDEVEELLTSRLLCHGENR